MNCTCTQCRQEFIVSPADIEFYTRISPIIAGKKYELPSPTLCPLCRQQRRQARRNERKLYNRKCDSSGRQIISIYTPDAPYKVYDNKVWWSDDFDGKQYGRDFDFTQPFFEQFHALQLAVPRPALFSKATENSDYTNHADHLKNCYLIMNGGGAEDCLYGNWIVYAKQCVDCSYIESCELCYEVSYSNNCYNCAFVNHSENCHDAAFLYDCKGVSNSLLCVGLRNKEYCIFNQQYSKEEYQQKKSEIFSGSFSKLQELKNQFAAFLLKMPHRAVYMTNSEDCSGQNIKDSKNCHDCFYLAQSQDCRYCFNSLDIKDCYDVYETGMQCELQIETHACNRSQHVGFCSSSYDNSDCWYCDLCHNCKNCFGCIGLKKAEYCILNKQYTKDQYEDLLSKIVQHMRTPASYVGGVAEWGEFFPISISPFAYNETQANETFPLHKDDVLTRGWRWHEENLGNNYQGEQVVLPDTMQETSDHIIEKILTCANCQKHYRIIKQELQFHRDRNLPLPRECIECRHQKRIAESKNITMHSKECAKCHKSIKTTYSPHGPEIIYCEECYLETIY